MHLGSICWHGLFEVCYVASINAVLGGDVDFSRADSRAAKCRIPFVQRKGKRKKV